MNNNEINEILWSLILEIYYDEKISFDARFYICCLINDIRLDFIRL